MWLGLSAISPPLLMLCSTADVGTVLLMWGLRTLRVNVPSGTDLCRPRPPTFPSFALWELELSFSGRSSNIFLTILNLLLET